MFGKGKETLTIGVEGMHCGHCAASVENGLKKVKGVSSTVVSLEEKKVTVTGKGLDENQLKAVINELGFQA